VVKVTRCHPRTKRKRVTVWVTIHRHGKKMRVRRRELRRVVLLPHVVNRTTQRVAHGRGTTVNGWLGTSTGVALPGQPVSVLAAADNDQGRFRLAAAVTTTKDGSWSVALPAGSSRLVEAVYPGSPSTEPANSGQVRVIVPAKVEILRIFPRAVAWGGTVRITGQLAGGYLPADGRLCDCGSGSVSPTRPTGYRSTSPATAGSRPATRSAPGNQALTAHSGFRSDRCRWVTTPTRPRKATDATCWLADSRAAVAAQRSCVCDRWSNPVVVSAKHTCTLRG
jgi:hypothetical protein